MTHMKSIVSKVTGVTYEGRQSILATLQGGEAVMLKPEPDNPYDPNAIAVWVATAEGPQQVGYIPRYLAAEIAPHLEGESLITKIHEVTGGFELKHGETAAYGLRLLFEYPTDEGDL